MNGLGAVMLLLLVATNTSGGALNVGWQPADRSRPWLQRVRWKQTVMVAMGASVAVLVVLAALSGPILDALSVSVGTWRLATSVPLAVVGLRWLVWPARPITEEPQRRMQVALLALTIMLGPQVVAVVLAAAAHDGVWRTLAGVALAAALSSVQLRRRGAKRTLPDSVLAILARLQGGGAILLAIALGVDGTKTI